MDYYEQMKLGYNYVFGTGQTNFCLSPSLSFNGAYCGDITYPLFNFSWNMFPNYTNYNTMASNNYRPLFYSNYNNYYSSYNSSSLSEKSSNIGFDTFTKSSLGTKSLSGVMNKYHLLSYSTALEKARLDSNLEELKGGVGWRIDTNSFINDIPFAKKGTTQLLNKICSENEISLVVTSAMGTKNSPHAKPTGQNAASGASHYNPTNPKLDFGGGLSYSKACTLKKQLEQTGLFSRISVEKDGETAHLDVQFKESAFANA